MIDSPFYCSKSTITFFLVVLFFLAGNGFLQGQTQQIFTTSGTFTVPAGVTGIRIECWGGGGGGSSITGNGIRGGGGGGGAYAVSEMIVSPGNTYSVVVGTGGAGSVNGGNSSFNTNTVIAAGGNCGIINSNVAGAGGTTLNSTGTTIFAGGNGAAGDVTANYSGGAGSGAGSTVAGNSAVGSTGTFGRTLNGGGGGQGVTLSSNGNNGGTYGGGGSGAVTNSVTPRSGGTGGNGLVVISWSTSTCQYSDNTSSAIVFTPVMNIPSNQQTVSNGFVSHQYFLLNVIKGLNYQVYTCSYPSQALKMAVYEEGNPMGTVIASSVSNSGNPCNSDPNNVYSTFTSPLSGQVRVLINSLVDCSSTSITGLTVNVNVTGGSNTQDDQNAAGTNSWIGHIYDGWTAIIPFNNYLGYYTQTETFQEAFGTTGTWPANANDDASSFNLYSNGTIRASERDVSFSVRYRMNSTKRGLYAVDMAGDDGDRLFVDGSPVYSDWSSHAPMIHSGVLFSLIGSSSLALEYFENTGQNIVGFYNLVQVLANSLSANTTQTICLGSSGLPVSGDTYGTLPTGITLSGTGYQWTYSTTPNGVRSNITGAINATFTPGITAPFNVPGTYYIFRNALLSSVNNVSPATYLASNESNPATIIVNPTFPASVSISTTTNPVCQSTTVTFIAVPVNGGTLPTYQWKVNGTNAGTNSATFSYTPVNNDAITCILTSNASPCLTGSPATSNTVTMTVIDPGVPISVSIAPSSNSVCVGSSVTFTATPVNGGTLPAYQWKVNGINGGTNSTTFSYTPLNNDVVTCILTSNASLCAIGSPATSNSVIMSVNQLNTITLNSAAGTNAQTVCINTNLTTITYATTGATDITSTGLPAGVTATWAGNVVTINGAPTSSGTFSYTISLTGGYCGGTASGTITVAPNPISPTTTGSNICIGSTATLSVSGALAGEKYKWYDASVGGTLLKTSLNNADNTYITAVLATTTNFWVSILSAGGCEGSRVLVTATFPSISGDDQTAAGSNSWIGHVYDGISFNSYYGHYNEAESFDQSFSGATACFGITSNSSARSIYTETFSVRYRMNSTRKGLYIVDLGSDDGSSLTVDGTLLCNNWTLQSFTLRTGVLMNLNGASSLIFDYYENNGGNRAVIQNFVQVLSNTLSSNTSQSICLGSSGSSIGGDVYGTLPAGISLSGSGYQWTYSTTPTGTRNIISGETGATFTPNGLNVPFNVPGTYYLFRNAMLSSTNNILPNPYVASNESNAATVTVNPDIPVSNSITTSANPICSSIPVTFTATPINGGTSPVYQWIVNGINVGTNSATYTYSPLDKDAVSCILTSNATPCAVGSPATSNSIKMMIIDANLPVSLSISPSANPVCLGTSVIFTATPVNGGTLPAYQWKVNGTNVGTNSDTYTFTPSNNDVVTCVLTSNASICANGSPATSNSVTLTVNPINTITLSSAAGTNGQSKCFNTSITNITYSTTGATGATYTGLPAGVSGSWATNTATISGTPSVVGTFNYTVTLTGGYTCTATATGSITVNAIPTAPTTTGASICIGSSALLSASGAVSGCKYKWYDAATAGTLLKTSTNEADNTYTTVVLGVTKNYWVSILNSGGCEGSRSIVTATFPTISADIQTDAGINSWIGHVYDGANFNTYFGHYAEGETFDESFGGGTNCFNITSNSSLRSIYTETFSVHYRMNSTKRGLYMADLGSDDGSRLTVDGSLIFDNWIGQSFTSRPRVLMNLTGSSSLLYDYFENGGSNEVAFLNFTQILSNTLSVNNSQAICIGNTGNAISGDIYGVLPTGISLSGTGYQWTYSTTPLGTRTAISGVTGATFSPNTLAAPFNSPGTYYIYRNAVLSSVNNISPLPYIATNESNPATIIINPSYPVSVTISASANPVWSNTAVIYTATPLNGGTTPVYQWKVNGTNAGINSSAFTYIPVNNDIITCVLTSSITPCALNNPATSNSVTMTVNTNKWKGATSNNWNTATNWTGNFVPASNASIVFDDVPLNHCQLDQNRIVTNITNAQSAYRILTNGYKLTVKGNLNFTNGAQIDASSVNSTVEFAGTSNQSIPSGTFYNDGIYNLIVNNAGNVTLSGTLNLLNTITSTSGQLDAFTNSPTVSYSGASEQTIETDQFLTDKVYNLTINNPVGVIDNTSFTVSHLLTINSGKILLIPAAKMMNVMGTITNNAGTSGLYIHSNSSNANGSLIFHNLQSSPVSASVEMYSKANWNLADTVGNKYKWQYFGIPLRSIIASPTFNGAYVRRWNEAGSTLTNHWLQLNNDSVLNSFIGYEICQETPKTYIFKGILENGDFNSGQLVKSSGAMYPGEHIFSNPYTAAIDITKLTFGIDTESTVYLYNTGSLSQWSVGAQTAPGNNQGQYTAVPQNNAGVSGLPLQVPSMEAMLVKAINSSSQANFGISYNAVVTANTDQMRVSSMNSISPADRICTMIDVSGTHQSDRMWIFSEPTCTHHFDNGWDGVKYAGSALSPQLFAMESDGNYQVNTVDNMNNTDLGFQAGEDIAYTLTFTNSNLNKQYAGVFLMDLLEHKTVDITATGSTYSFLAQTSADPIKRFKIFTRNIVNDTHETFVHLNIFSLDKTTFVQNYSNLSGNVVIYDIAGHFLASAFLMPSSITQVPIDLIPGVYVVKAMTANEKVIKRIIIL